MMASTVATMAPSQKHASASAVPRRAQHADALPPASRLQSTARPENTVF
jgi:hypothetical protein